VRTPDALLQAPPKRAPTTIGATLSVSAAHELAGRIDQRMPRPCHMHCDGSKEVVRLRFEDERDYRVVLIGKSVGAKDEFHVSNINRDTTTMLVENAELGEMMALHGEDALKVCSKRAMALSDCNWSCDVDVERGVVTMKTNDLAADFAIVCY